MSDEHGWADFHEPDDHHDPGAGHDFTPSHEPVADDGPFHDDLFGHDDLAPHDAVDGTDLDAGDLDGGDTDGGWDDVHEPGTGHDDDVADHGVVDVSDGHGLGPIGADPDAAPDLEQVSVFPPVVDVGPLPEPVDGFPWIDTGSLGLYHAGPVDTGAEAAVPAQDLAAYAAQDLPPGADPWAALADSDDPATSTLAKWWNQPD
ncbi:hypothetical protein ACFQFC_04080 [Amorphoplanes digitatis]|uniref:Uncharacterized protein n=1 Tax=Actinoplanes digitatis TaxID=1868 RepID=A0A7W7HYX5_9ACTN|nr:hypothetical protein [Actinoplanes digitatis]MBB4763359.1 hypothetical protein [Actinoplanes digitatis]BFE72438.1 hypothetical protein GCM10020092_057390 [Actinoplanes digitatis]GID92179.1 hypothetical protein Adi01nite_15910 [Actinoplanes digitatis]